MNIQDTEYHSGKVFIPVSVNNAAPNDDPIPPSALLPNDIHKYVFQLKDTQNLSEECNVHSGGYCLGVSTSKFTELQWFTDP